MQSAKGIKKETDIDSIQEVLDYDFHSKRLLIRSLTRFQYAKERRDRQEECEDQLLLATLGDAILKAALTDIFFELGYETSEQITEARKEIEERDPLAEWARELYIGRFIILGEGEKKQGSEKDPGVLAETLEAVIAAIFLDSGFETTKGVIKRLFKIEDSRVIEEESVQN